MKIVQAILTKNDCYRSGRQITVKGLMLHSVGCSQPSAQVFTSRWNKAGVAACVHAFIDGNTGDVYQTLPWNHRGWHAGGSANNTHIGVEMCEPACIKYTGGSSFTCSDTAAAKAVAQRTYKAAVELFAYLCKQYGLNPLTQICSHAEGYKKGIATNHGDPEHLWRGLNMGYTMDKFRQEVKAAMSGSAVPEQPDTDNTKLAVDGSWGPATTRRTQQFLKTTADGVVSNQPAANKPYLYSADTSTWEFKTDNYDAGSAMVRALQKLIGATQDGWFGRQSVIAFQKFLGVAQDGSMGPETVRAWQTYLNKQ